MTGEILETLLRANVVAALAVGLVALLRRPVRRAFGARVAYGLWALPLLAGVGAMLPQPAAETLPFVGEAAGAAGRAMAAAAATDRGDGVVLSLWLAGVAASAAWTWRLQRRFVDSLGRLEPVAGTPRVWRAASAGAGPAVVGAIRPRIVTPSDFETRFDAAERDVILAHEAAHLRTGDAWVNAVLAALTCLCWFNPLVHWGARALRVDQELACDAAVVARFPQARRLYGALLLKTQLGTQPLPVGCHWPAGSAHPLKERIVMLKSPLPARARRRLGLAVVGSLAALCAGAAWATGATDTQITDPVWIYRPTGEDIARVYPRAAVRANLSGNTIIKCRVDEAGRLTACEVVAEDPAGRGFGQAALALAPRFRMRTETRSGVPTAGAEVRIPIMFRMLR